jgi:hypothetical protein
MTDAIASNLVAALERAWAGIRERHPELPAVFVIIGSGDEGGRSKRLTYGHFWALKWVRGEEELHELFIGGEGLKRQPVEVLTTLIHEAAHTLAHVRGIQDTSRRGIYHNKRFAAIARELGITPALDAKIGWSPCTMPEDTQDAYRQTIEELTAALDVYRRGNVRTATAASKSRNQPVAVCACGPDRKIRVSAKQLEDAPIMCRGCGQDFEMVDSDDDGE